MGWNSLALTHSFMARHVRSGAFCIDATAGRGRDTVLLARLAGPAGRVLALDVQEEAVEATARETLIEMGNQVANTVIDTVVRSLLYTLSYLVCFLLANVVLRLLAKLVNLTFKLPGLHGLNSFGGGLFGLVEGWLLTTLALWLLMAFTDHISEELIQETFLTRFLFSHSFFSSL